MMKFGKQLKISESNRKRKLSDETKTKIAASLRARKQNNHQNS